MDKQIKVEEKLTKEEIELINTDKFKKEKLELQK